MCWENNTQCCGHTVDAMEMCEAKGPQGKVHVDHVLSDFEMSVISLLMLAVFVDSNQPPLL